MKKPNLGLGFRNKKANSITDTLTLVVMIFAFVIFMFFGKYLLGIWNDDVSADPDISDTAKEMVDTHNTRYANLFDGMFMTFFLLIWALVLIASWKIDAHPIFFVFTLLMLIFVFIGSAYLGNAYEEIITDSDLVDIAPQHPMANFVMSNMLMVSIAVGFSIALVLFAKNRMMS